MRRLFAIGSQLSPEVGSSGIEMLETDTFKLHCFQTLTGIKFVVLADPRQAGIDSLLRKIYEIYSDFALKNPFYSLEMPIRCELFDQNLKLTRADLRQQRLKRIYSGFEGFCSYCSP
ncbi:PREDICTED: trafficking protein particle complex subunit 4 [Charadrius vociferus]|uniref:trafficking protein particle complex subunit 4 n=1 Tax=Charadrius vociferus TaxID=50402 RepID=UPI000521BD5E|nr:PREDICTED: trafficking protein particle complex subunit 4 [Charadrius vociferus]